MSILTDDILEAIKKHTNEAKKRECCGVIVNYRRRNEYIRIKNVSGSDSNFVMDAVDYAKAEDKGVIIAIVHSHPELSPKPSQADLVGIEKTQLPWVIMNWPTGSFTWNEPTGYIAPLEGRQFSHGILDCYTIIRDYYQRNLGITLKDYDRPDHWWLKGMDLYRDNFKDTNFIEVTDGSLKLHDFILIQLASPVANHAAIYLGDHENMILHHVDQKVSCRDVYGGYWRDATRLVLRHKELF
jgi:proteasome lid subunit RPN8/RPN11